MGTLLDFIDDMIKIETWLIRLYAQLTSTNCGDPAIALFGRLTIAGERHIEVLRNVKILLEQSGEGMKPVQLRPIYLEQAPLEAGYDSDIKKAYHAIRKHLDLEQYSSEAYSSIHGSIENSEIKSLLKTLSEEEDDHHNELKRLLSDFESRFGNLLRRQGRKTAESLSATRTLSPSQTPT